MTTLMTDSLLPLASALLATLITTNAYAQCPLPDYLATEIVGPQTPSKPGYIYAEFSWSDASALEECEAGRALEIEFSIFTDGDYFTDEDKCFAQPIGGKDEIERPKWLAGNLPKSYYVDVWNYYFDYTEEEFKEIVSANCDASFSEAFVVDSFFFDNLFSIADDHAQFAIGIKDVTELQANVKYWFEYPLEYRNKTNCLSVDSNEAWVAVTTQDIRSTCELAPAYLDPPQWGETVSCAHLIGFNWCSGWGDNGGTRSLVNRLCAPTDFVTFTGARAPGSANVTEEGGYCIDDDEDGLFAIWPSGVMYGTQTGDCDDDPATGLDVGNGGYDPLTNMCMDCSPSVTSVVPKTANIGDLQAFSVFGSCLPSNLGFHIDWCQDIEKVFYSPDQLMFTCTPTGVPAKREGIVKNRPGGIDLYPFEVDFLGNDDEGCPGGAGDYCGGPAGLDPNKLYYCSSGIYTESCECPFGCAEADPEYNDYCNGTCPSNDNGLYCGDPDLGLDQGTLYYCANGGYCDPEPCPDGVCTSADQGDNDYCGEDPVGETCNDGIQNQGETGVDCGGPCPPCSGTCNDGIQNQGETGIDCGGPCPPCDPGCDCNSGTCCDGCNFRPSNFVCDQNADSQYSCSGNGCGDDLNVQFRDQLCPGNASSCSGGYGPWGGSQVADNCTADETCSINNQTCVADQMCGCNDLTYWTPDSIQDLDNDGTQYINGNPQALATVGIRIEIDESATPGHLRLRMCKVDNPPTNLSGSVHVYFKNGMNQIMVNTTLAAAGTCTVWYEMNNDGGYSDGEILAGDWRLVSPSGSASEWTYECLKAQANDATGTCWWDPSLPPMERTCKQ